MSDKIDARIKALACTLKGYGVSPTEIATICHLNPKSIWKLTEGVEQIFDIKKMKTRASPEIPREKIETLLAKYPTGTLEEMARELQVSASYLGKVFVQYGVVKSWHFKEEKNERKREQNPGDIQHGFGF